MASFILNYEILKVMKNQITWRGEFKKGLMMAGVDNKKVSFLCVDI